MNNVITSCFSTFKSNWRYITPFSNNVGYIGWLGYGNFGDEVMYIAFQKMFQKLNIVPFKDTKKMELFERITGKRIYKSVCLGGGTLINNKDFSEILRTALQKKYPAFVLGSGVRNPSFWDCTAKQKSCLAEWIELLKECFFVGVRGPLSKKILESHNYNKAEITGDPALFLARAQIKQKERKKTLGINIGISNGNVWGNEENILSFIVKFIKIIVSDGWQITFLPVWDKDVPYIEEAKKRSGINVPIFYEYSSLKKTMSFLEKCDVFIGEKLHSVILAFVNYTPSIMLEYRPKCLDFMMSMGLEKYNIRTDRLNLDLIVDLLEESYANLDYFQKIIYEKANFYKNLQKEKTDIITNHILKDI